MSGTLSVVVPLPVVALTGTYTGPVPSDTSNALDGLEVVCVVRSSMTPSPVAAPATLVLADRYDKAVPYPVPSVSNGRVL